MEFLQLKVVDIVRTGKDAATIFLKDTHNKKISYKAGQFLTFIFKRNDTELRRSYSICSTPGIDEQIGITVKRIVNGEISRFLLDHIKLKDLLTALTPAGKFTVETDAHVNRQFFFVAAGSGIVPVYSLIKQILHEEKRSNIFLIYQNHNEEQIIFKTEFAELQKKHPEHLHITYFFSKPIYKHHSPQRLTNNLLEEWVVKNGSAKHEKLFYLCGPSSFMRMCQFTLRWMGFEETRIKKENFTVDYVPPPPLIKDQGPKKITIHINHQTLHFEAAYPQTILDAALKINIQLPYSCRGGRCSTCVATCVQGLVKMSINEVLTEGDLKKGLVLTCVGYAESNVELEF
jgi:ring-1,2-phenylacetyl-CoA epoxidase subunit PaaE